jgi:hypothetical protein
VKPLRWLFVSFSSRSPILSRCHFLLESAGRDQTASVAGVHCSAENPVSRWKCHISFATGTLSAKATWRQTNMSEVTAPVSDRACRRLDNKHQHNISTLEKALAWTVESAKASGCLPVRSTRKSRSSFAAALSRIRRSSEPGTIAAGRPFDVHACQLHHLRHSDNRYRRWPRLSGPHVRAQSDSIVRSDQSPGVDRCSHHRLENPLDRVKRRPVFDSRQVRQRKKCDYRSLNASS